MFKLYIFDMGGVVVQQADVLPQIAAHLGISLAALRRWSEDCWLDLMAGRMTAETFWRKFSARSGMPIAEELFGKFFQPLPDRAMGDLIQRLRTRARVVCGTNTLEEHYAIHLARGDYDIFDAVYASHRTGIAKPQRDFYQQILTSEGVLPSEAVFIDDLLENVCAAQSLHIQAIQFSGYERLRQQLASL